MTYNACKNSCAISKISTGNSEKKKLVAWGVEVLVFCTYRVAMVVVSRLHAAGAVLQSRGVATRYTVRKTHGEKLTRRFPCTEGSVA